MLIVDLRFVAIANRKRLQLLVTSELTEIKNVSSLIHNKLHSKFKSTLLGMMLISGKNTKINYVPTIIYLFLNI